MSSQEPTDCINSVIVCGNSEITFDVNGVGTQELNAFNSCGGQENNSIWLKVTIVEGGSLGFTLRPNSSDLNEDFDFFVFGPNVSCSNIGHTIRCSTTNPIASGQTNNLTGMNSSSLDTSEGPGPFGNGFVKSLDTNAGETYFLVIDRPIGNSPFSLEWTGTAKFSEPPLNQSLSTGTPLDFEQCDIVAPFNNGSTPFMLSDNTPRILGSQTDVTITYHLSASDANIGINTLTSPYANIRNPQRIYARITDNNTKCFELTDFTLNVNSGPDFTPPSDFERCDNANDGDDQNGQVNFNLTSKNDEILNGQNPADFNITYYTSQTNAETKTNPLPNLYYNATAYSEQVFVRIEDVVNPECKSVTPLNLVVSPKPDAFNHSILQCDEDGSLDGLTVFNLNEANADLTGGIPDRSTKFYSNPARSNEIDAHSYHNTSNPQTIYVDVINDDTGCINQCELTLRVSTTGSNDTSLPAVCDDDGVEDGFHSFNLRDADAAILTGLPSGLTVFYYETYNDALLEQRVLEDSFTNTVQYSQTIFARVENANDCYGISEVTLTVRELPPIDAEALTYYCLNTFPETITLSPEIYNDSPSNYTYSWSTGAHTYNIQINEPNTYNVTVTNTYGCYKNKVITVAPSNIATLKIETDQTTPNNVITVFATGEGSYEYRLLNENNVVVAPYQESHIFENVYPGIYNVTVKDVKNDCGTATAKAYIIGFPRFFTPNNDGINDTWQIQGISSVFQPHTTIRIFNRYGQLIKQISPLGKGWNGTVNGEKLPVDDYWFSVKLQDGTLFKSHFSLKY